MERAVDVRGSYTTDGYFIKQADSSRWEIDRELASASSRRGRKSGVHPFELLKAAVTDGHTARLFLEYVEAFKGKRQLVFGRGLKAQIGLASIEDEQLVSEQREDADLLASLSLDDWKVVRFARARAHVLDAAERGGSAAVTRLVHELYAAAGRQQ
jgi:hypothetical protein